MCTVLIEGGAISLGPVSVLKFGSSLLSDAGGFERATEEVACEVSRGRRVVVVVSAVRGATDRLLRDALGLSARPPATLLALLLRTGEDASVALMGIGLVERRLNAHVLTATDLCIRTRGPLDDAEPCDFDLERLVTCLRAHDVVVVPGFVGADDGGRASILGRGGSDLTALFLGSRLGAERIRLLKDVDGVYPTSPGAEGFGGEPLGQATWGEVERVGNGVVQPKALRFAERERLPFRVAGLGGEGTLVGGAS